MVDRYAVLGNPVAHSQSPQIHAAFARQTSQDLEYGRMLVPRDGFRDAVLRFREGGGRGLNVTLPFKLEALAIAGEAAARAQRAGAANVLAFDGGRIRADNTDGTGLVRDLTANLGVTLGGARILVAGAGGAARGILPALCDCAPSLIALVHRTADKARALAAALGGGILVLGYDELAHRAFDLVINATSAGIAGVSPPLPASVFARDALAYDLMYGDAPTPFMRFATESGAGRVADGLGMLVEQAAESFLLWRGVRPATAPVLAQLRAGR